MTEGPDTVTPLDGDGRNVTGLGDQFDDRPRAEDYETKGQTTVATRHGFRYAPQDKSLPLIDSRGVKMTREQADEVVKQAEGTRAGVHIVENDKED